MVKNNNAITRDKCITIDCDTICVGGKNQQSHHFFGYYNKTNWDCSSRYVLGQSVKMFTGNLTGKEVASVGYFDLKNSHKFIEIGCTTTWNWQMGAQLQWLGNNTSTNIIYNKRRETSDISKPYPDFCSVVYNTDSKAERTLPLPIYVVSSDGKNALSVDYSRLQHTHETIGYNSTVSELVLKNSRDDDGIFLMDTASGEYELVCSLERLKNNKYVESMKKAIHWVTHLEISPNSKKCLFIHRWTERVKDETCFLHRLYVMDLGGDNLQLLECSDHPLPQLDDSFDINAIGVFDYEKSEYQISHPMWKDDNSVIVWSPHNGEIHYHLYDINTNDVEIVGQNILVENGHMTYEKTGKWLLTDTYPDANDERLLLLFNTETNDCIDIGVFYTSPDLGKHNRCDLHPKWSADNKAVCIDSVHEGVRQMYIIDTTKVTGELFL